ncbi:MAG TPA: energy transducer TonB [Bryobacteraceae bacterium]|nr:energy transducer TonB [Bryobacteraceae bacterium]
MQRVFFSVLVLAGGMAAIGQNTRLVKQQPPYRIGGDVTAPVVVYKTEPQYSDEARIATMEGTATIAAVVGEDGVPRDLRVTRPLGLGLDDKALTAAQNWRFRPGMKAGLAVPVSATIQVNFRRLRPPDRGT